MNNSIYLLNMNLSTNRRIILLMTLPLIQKLGVHPEHLPRGLVIVPTRELALQVADDLRLASKNRTTRIVDIYGGKTYESQIEDLKKGADVVVGTPGRLIDLHRQRILNLSAINYLVLDEADGFKVKRICVKGQSRLSYQRHQHRQEHWFVVQGVAHVTIDGEVHEVPAGAAIDIPLQAAHRVANRGEETLIFIEVQRGSYLGEDDIERLEDDYGRS